MAQKIQFEEDRQGMPAIIHARSLVDSRISPSSSDECSGDSGEESPSSDQEDEMPELEPVSRCDWRYLPMATARFKCVSIDWWILSDF